MQSSVEGYSLVYNAGVVMGHILGALITGAFLGTIPLLLGLVRKKKDLAIIGLIACIASSFIAGIILSVPLSILFVILILFTGRKQSE